MIIASFFSAVFQILSMLINTYIWLIIIHSLILIFQPSFSHPIMQVLDRLTSPLYQKIRKIIPTIYANIDFAPLIVIIGLKFLDLFLIRLFLQSLA